MDPAGVALIVAATAAAATCCLAVTRSSRPAGRPLALALSVLVVALLTAGVIWTLSLLAN